MSNEQSRKYLFYGWTIALVASAFLGGYLYYIDSTNCARKSLLFPSIAIIIQLIAQNDTFKEIRKGIAPNWRLLRTLLISMFSLLSIQWLVYFQLI